MEKPRTCWLTINRACNLRCEWCYGFETSFRQEDTMPYERACQLIDIAVGIGISNFLLIGGEPTIHPQLLNILDCLAKKDRKVTIVTNGIRLSDASFCQSVLPYASRIHFGISLKGSSDDYYGNHCGAAVYHKVKKGIENCRSNNFDFSLSYVISADNVNNLCSFAKEIRAAGIDEFISFSFCNETINSSGEFEEFCKEKHPLWVNKRFSEQYSELNNILCGQFSLHQTLPLCMCDNDLIDKMVARNQIATSCHVHNRAGVIFDTDGSILLCNHFIGYGVGTLGEDYLDAKSFLNYWNSQQLTELHKKLTTMPSLECRECKLQENCGGGCCIQWFDHEFNEYKSFYNTLN